MLLSIPRPILVQDPSAELDELFQRLAHVEARQRRRPTKPDLKKTFEDRLFGVPLQHDLTIEVPVFGEIDIPYAYQNGALNLVRPEGFPLDGAAATAKASELAVKGHLIYKHSVNTAAPQKLIVVGGFDSSVSEDMKQRIGYVLREHDARLVREDEMEAFVDEVRREAHR